MHRRYLSYEDVKAQVLHLAQQIQECGWKPDYVVGLTRGGLLPAVMLSHWFGVRCETLKVSLRDDGGDSESNFWMAEDAFGYVDIGEVDFSDSITGVDMSPRYTDRRKNILIVDDINDSGATINWIKQDWRRGCMPDHPSWNDLWHNNVRFAVLVNNLASEAKIDWASTDVNKAEDDVWIVFPWEEWWRKKEID